MSIGCPGGSSLFGNRSSYIKTNGGDIIATDGAETREKQMLSDLRIPYKQILKSRVILKIGQTNYLLNHLGLGDNATFLSIRAIYDSKSVIPDDNYISWSYSDDLTRINYMGQWMVLTGNPTNRIPQLYITNPSQKYPVFLDVMVAVIDDNYSFFNDSINQTGTSFTGIEVSDIHSHIVGESIVFNDKSSPVKPLIYITLNNINSIQRNGNILILDDESLGVIFFQFLTTNDAVQAQSLLNYILENPSVDIDNIDPLEDSQDPVIYFNSTAGISGDYITFSGATTSVPYNTLQSFTFSTSISLLSYGTSSGSYFDKTQLIDLLVDSIDDNRDGSMIMSSQNLIITGTAGELTTITYPGTYSVTFDFSDIALNYLDEVVVNLDILP